MKHLALLSILILWSQLSTAYETDSTKVPRRQYLTARTSQPPRLDGIPNEQEWNNVQWSSEFVQHEPAQNVPPSYQTAFKVIYDDKYLYLAYRAYDAAADSIVKRMGRRDDFPGDWVEVNIDAYHDQRTAFSFTLSVSGVRGDEFISDNGNNWDPNWNPIWYAKTHVDDSGWTAEVKIPFSQLRYGNEEDKVWGLQVQRRIFRKEERSTWQFIPRNSGVWVSGFGELRGLKGIPSQKQIEIAPYVVAQTSKYKTEEGNPFATGTDSKVSAGVDGKLAVTSDLILDFSVNPDFGQVEADPSQVRIDGYQNFFEERRPFFIESRNIFDYRLTGSAAGGDYDSDLLFYSRRIGGRPHGNPSLNSGEYAKVPDNTSILGAAKFSGKTKKGWSIGVLESITKREMARIVYNDETRQEVVEPLTNYFVGRLQKDHNGGNTVLGGIVTAVNRENVLSNTLHNQAYSGGIDFLHYWKNRTWYYSGKGIVSHIAGSPESIYRIQTAFEHLFQRSNITEARADPSRTSLTGTAGTFKLGKAGGKQGKYGEVFRFESGLTWRSPELELNDIGFMLAANEINHFTWGGYEIQRPFSIFRNGRVSYNHWARWDFAGQLLYLAFNANIHATFKNYWSTGYGVDWNPYDVSNNALRGGSSLRKPPGAGFFMYVNSDSRKKINANLNISTGGGFHSTVGYNDYSLTLRVQPLDALNISLSAGYNSYFRKQDQFVEEVDFNSEKRIIVGRVDQETIRLTLRANYNITPDLTLQYYGQPFITRPKYGSFGYVTDPLNRNYDSRFRKFTEQEISFKNGQYEIDETGDGAADYTFSKPDFNFIQFRSNLVVRWEYKAGSEFYLVWSQGNTPDVATDLDRAVGTSLYENIFSQQATNIFLVKFTYRFLR